MGRTKGSKNKKTKTTTKTANKNTNINNVHVHVEKTKTRRRRTKPQSEPNNNPLSNTIGITRPSSQNLGFHPRGLINNEPQQPTIINIQPTAQIDELQKKLKKYKDKLNANKAAQDTTNQNLLTQLKTQPQQPRPVNVNVNPFNPPVVKPGTIEKTKTPLKKSVVRFPKSKTKAGAAFKPSELDDSMSVASMHSSISGMPGTYQEEEPILTGAAAAKSAAERLKKFHERQSKEEKKLENRLYSLKGTGDKAGGIEHAKKSLLKMNEELPNAKTQKQKKSLEKRIERMQNALNSMEKELPEVEAKLKAIRESREPVKKGRPGLLGAVTSLFSPAK